MHKLKILSILTAGRDQTIVSAPMFDPRPAEATLVLSAPIPTEREEQCYNHLIIISLDAHLISRV